VVVDPVGRDHAKADILTAAPLDPSARALADRIRVQQQRHHHRRLERGPTPAVLPIHAVEGAQIDLADRVEHKPGQMILRQPLAQTRRQQQLLLTITGKEVLGHDHLRVDRTLTEIVLASPDDKPRLSGVCATASKWGLFPASLLPSSALDRRSGNAGGL